MEAGETVSILQNKDMMSLQLIHHQQCARRQERYLVLLHIFSELKNWSLKMNLMQCGHVLHYCMFQEKIRGKLLSKFVNRLNQKGFFIVLYCSWKYGIQDREEKGRHFTDLTERELQALLSDILNYQLIKMWRTDDARPGNKQQWLNVLLRKDCNIISKN